MSTIDILLANPSTRKIIFGFIDNLPERIKNIKHDIESKSRIDLKDHAHELKGTAATFGFDDISKAAGELEALAESSSFKNLQVWVDRIELFALQACNDSRLDR